MIDELQNLDEAGAQPLKVLHEGRHGCPAHGDERRQSCYEGRLANAGGIAPLVRLAEAFDAVGEITEEAAVAAVGKPGRDGPAIMDAAVQHGVVTLAADSMLRVDIPSFLTHLKDLAAKHQAHSQRGCW